MGFRGHRRSLRFAIDLTWVVLSLVLAVLVQDNFVISVDRLQETVIYGCMSIMSAVIVFSAAGLHRHVWRYVSFVDLFHVVVVAAVAIVLAMLATFLVNRLEGIHRSLPAIQWLILVAGLVASRVGVRLLAERIRGPQKSSPEIPVPKEHILVVGFGDLSELYLRAIFEVGRTNFEVVGLLSSRTEMVGRTIRMYKVLGRPEDIQRIISDLDIHGIGVDRIVVAELTEHLSKDARKALGDVERSTGIKVEWLIEQLGLQIKAVPPENTEYPRATAQHRLMVSPYHRVKRVIDAAAALILIFLLMPLLALAALLTSVDVGLPVLFWQQRPGRYGKSLKLYKFRTMRAAHDQDGHHLADELRSSMMGRLLRRSRLDELPQLYNILIGEMSFVGPRPLLPLDQPRNHITRLLVRPGLTGFAQVNGGRHLSPEDKARLDEWYIANASLWLDIKILLRTFYTIVAGDKPKSNLMQRQENVEDLRPIGAARLTSFPAHRARKNA